MKNIALYFLAFVSLSASAFDEFLITDIRIVGLQRVSIGSIFTAIPVSVGDKIIKGDRVLVIEAMKMETIISAEKSGTIKKLHVGSGDNVETKDLLIEIE